MIAHTPPFLKFFELGYKRLVPIVPPDAELSPRSSLSKRPGSRGKAVGIKGNEGLWCGYDWLRAEPPSIDQLHAWAAMGAGVGIRTGDGLVALDIDSLDEEIASLAERSAHSLLGRSPVRIGKPPKRLMVYRTAERIPYMRIEFTGHEGKNERIELLSDDKQFVAYGLHPGTGKPYIWNPEPSALEDTPTVTEAQLRSYFEALAGVLPQATVNTAAAQASDRSHIDQHTLTADLAKVTAAVNALPNDNSFAPTYDDYIRVGAAIKGATQDDPQAGLELFLSWAERWQDGENDLEQVEADYGRIKPPYELGARWLYDMAEKHAPHAFDSSSVWLQPISDTTSFPLDTGHTPTTERKRFEVVPLSQAAATALTDANAPLIKGLLDQQAMTILYGASNTGKTFVSMDIAYHIATGLPWAGMRTTKLPVVYIAAEGGRGAKRRADALIKRYEDTAENFYLIMTSVDLLRPEADLPSLLEAISPYKPGFIVVDTLSRAIAGGDENSSTDMGALVKNLDALRQHTKAHVLVVHHSGKDAAKGARGHSLLRAATDTEIEIADSRISVTKQRDMDGSFSCGFSLEPVALGVDADGDQVTSCTVRLLQAGEEIPLESVAGKEGEVLEAIAILIDAADRPEKGVSAHDVVGYFADDTPAMTLESARNHIKRLCKKQRLKRAGHGQYVLKTSGQSGQKGMTISGAERFMQNEVVKSGHQSGQDIFA